MSAGNVTSLDLIRVMTWLSPAFPVGAFAYSHGLERAVHDGLVHDRQSLEGWISDLVEHGSAWNDAILLAEAWRNACDGEPIADVAELCAALAGSGERYRETMLQGAAFMKAAAPWAGDRAAYPPAPPYPIAVGVAAAEAGIGLTPILAAFLHAFVSNLAHVAVRTVPIGQSAALVMLAALEPLVVEIADRAARSGLDDLGTASFMSDIMAMKHETQYSRLFRS
jgi:urease accessory protein